MSHRRIQETIPAYVARRLDAEATRELELHLATCAECQELVSCGEELAAEIRTEGRPADAAHPAPRLLREFAESGIGDDVARHAEHCASCALEVSVWKRRGSHVLVPQRERERRGIAWLQPWLAWRPLAVGCILGATVGAGTLIAFRSPRPSWHGTAEVLLLREPVRGSSGQDTPRVGVRRGQPVIPLELELPASFDEPAGTYEFEVRAEDASSRVRLSVEGEDVRAQLLQTGTFRLYLDARDLPPGSYVLVVRRRDETIREQPFEIAP